MASVASTALMVKRVSQPVSLGREEGGYLLVQGHDDEVSEILAAVQRQLLTAPVEQLLQWHDGQERD